MRNAIVVAGPGAVGQAAARRGGPRARGCGEVASR